MGLLAIIRGDEPVPPGARLLNPHGIQAVIGEFQRGSVTSNQALGAMNVTGPLAQEITAWVGGFPRLNAALQPITREKIHDVLNALEQGAYTVAQAEAQLDYTTTA